MPHLTVTFTCTNYYYFWSQSRIYHPQGCKNLQTKQGKIYNAVLSRQEINAHKAKHYHSLHLLGDLVTAKMVIKGTVDTPVRWVMADGISTLAAHLGYCGFLVFLKYK